MSLDKQILLYLAVIALLGTVTNYVYFSPLLTLLLPLCIYAFNKDKMVKPIAWLYAYLILFLVSVILYHPLSLVEFDFYRRDGNFIISYTPLLLLPLFNLQFNIDRYLRYFYGISVGLYGILFIYYVFTIDFTSDIRAIVFGGLFYAQNAVGGFLGILGSLGFAYYYHRRRKRELFYFFIILLALFATYSRGSILGLIFGIAAWYLAIHSRFKTLVLLIAIPVLLTVGTLMIGYPFYQNQIATGNMVEEKVGEDFDTKNANVILRIFYTFPRAYYTFKASPVLGTGVGSYDDRPYQFESIFPYLAYNAQPTKAHTDSHAHHSYLHILAEQGILGLGVFLIFWVSLFFYLMKVKKRVLIRDFLLIAYFTITFASFTEHRISTPSMMLPFTISLGLFMAHTEIIKRYRIVEDEHE